MASRSQKKRSAKPRLPQEPLQQGQENSTWPTLPFGSAVQVPPFLDTRALRAQGCSFPVSSNLTLARRSGCSRGEHTAPRILASGLRFRFKRPRAKCREATYYHSKIRRSRPLVKGIPGGSRNIGVDLVYTMIGATLQWYSDPDRPTGECPWPFWSFSPEMLAEARLPRAMKLFRRWWTDAGFLAQLG